MHDRTLFPLAGRERRPAHGGAAPAGLLASMAALAVLAGCGGGPTGPGGGGGGGEGVAAVEVSPEASTLSAVGETVQFEAVARDADGAALSGVSFTWASSDETVATVDGDGLAEAVGDGEAEITATASGESGSATLAVARSVEAVTVSPASATLTAVGDTVRFTATATDENGTGVPGVTFAWSSGDTTVATVDEEGLATARAEGEVTVAASAGEAGGQAALTVDPSVDHLAFRTQPRDVAAGDTIDPPVRVEVADRFGNVVVDADLTISLSLEGLPFVLAGGFEGTTTVDAVDGVAVFDDLWIRRAHADYTLEATTGGSVPAATSRTFEVSPGDVARLAFSGQPSTVTAGQPIDPAVEVTLRDDFGNVVEDAGDPVTVEIADGPGGASLSGTVAATPASGVATFDDLVIETAGSGYTLRAVAGGVTSAPSDAFGVRPGAPAALGFLAQPTVAEGREPLDPPVQVEVRDSFGNRVTDASMPVTLSLGADPTEGRATLSGGTDVTVDASRGVATFGDLRVDLPGDGFTLGATSGTLLPADSDPFGVRLTFASLGVGFTHTCGVTTAGHPYCWGANGFGQLGDGTLEDSDIPVDVSTGGERFAVITAGFRHTCALTTGGEARCWGANGSGQLGDGGTGDTAVPVAVSGGLAFDSIDAGHHHTCGVTPAEDVHCWGENGSGQLGDGTTTDRHVPTPVDRIGSLPMRSVSAGEAHTCANGVDPYCWGENGRGQLGAGISGDRDTAVAVQGEPVLITISAGRRHSCGVNSIDEGYCWGANGSGQLGDGRTEDSSSPFLEVEGDLDFATISAGGGHSCGLTTDGDGHCWGANAFGQLGDATRTDHLAPVPVRGGHTFTAVGTGVGHTCGLATDGVYCWGSNDRGQLGDGTTSLRVTPERVVQ